MAVVLAALILVSTVAPALATSAVATSSSPSGMVGLADDQVSSNIPEQAKARIPTSADAWAPSSAKHANYMTVEVTTEARAKGKANSPRYDASTDDVVLNWTDDRNHEARTVAVDASTLEQAVGHRPTMAYGVHESGDTWSRPITYEDGMATWTIPKFSTNSVSFDGTLNLQASPAADGDSYSFNTSDGGENLVINVTGVTNREWDNETKSGLTDGSSMALSVGGDASPTGDSTNGEPTVKFTGVKNNLTAFRDANDNVAFYAPDGTVTTTTESGTKIGGVADLDGDGRVEAIYRESGTDALKYVDPSGEVTNLSVTINGYLGGIGDVDGDGDKDIAYRASDGYLNFIDPSGNIIQTSTDPARIGAVEDFDGDGVAEAAFRGRSNGYLKHIGQSGSVASSGVVVTDLGGAGDVDGDGDLDVVTSTSSELSFVDMSGNMINTSASPAYDQVGGLGDVDGDGNLEAAYRASSDDTLRWVSSNGDKINTSTTTYYPGYIDGSTPLNPGVDIDGDGTAEASVSGSLAPGETATVELSELSTSTSDATVIMDNLGGVDISIRFEEGTKSTNPVVELNNASDSYAGTLADGETATLSISDSAIKAGENQVNVSVGDGTLSSDAPTPQVELNLTHDVVTQKSIDYEGEAFSERYGVNKTWADGGTDAEFSVAWASDRVVRVDDVKVKYYNTSDTLDHVDESPAYTAENGTLTVQLGDIPAGWTTRVIANGSKVKVKNGDITVLEPTNAGNTLNTKIRIDNKSEGFAISVGGTHSGDLIHHLEETSYTGADEYTVIDANGKQQLRAPEASSGSTAYVRTIPVSASPEAGEVHISVDDTSSTTEPEFTIVGPANGNDVAYTFVEAKDDQAYVLYSTSNDVVRDSGTANSPLTLVDDDSLETLAFFEDDDGDGSTDSSSSDGGSSDGGDTIVGGARSAGGGLGDTIILLVIAAILAGVWWISQRYGSGEISSEMLLVAEGLVLAPIALELVSGASLVAGVANGIQALLEMAGLGLKDAMPLVILIVGGALLLWLRNRGKPTKVNNITIGGGK